MPTPKKKRYVQCPSCSNIYHKVTIEYKPTATAHPGMLRLIKTYADLRWDEPPPDRSAGYGVLMCPGCHAALAPSGSLKVVSLTNKELKDAVSRQL